MNERISTGVFASCLVAAVVSAKAFAIGLLLLCAGADGQAVMISPSPVLDELVEKAAANQEQHDGEHALLEGTIGRTAESMRRESVVPDRGTWTDREPSDGSGQKTADAVETLMENIDRPTFGLALRPEAAEFEELARDHAHFSRTVIVDNRELRSRVVDGVSVRGSDALARRQLELRESLQALSDRDGLPTLLEHPDPRVRTLVLGAIFQRENPGDLPLIASRLDDGALTFPDLHNAITSQPGPRPMGELESPQSVGEVARAMLALWGVSPHAYRHRVTTEDFDRYWGRFRGRDHSADWFLFKISRATRRTSPLRPDFHDDVERVVAEMNALPANERAWVQLFVHVGSFTDLEVVLPEATIVKSLKEVGAEKLVRFLERERVSDDPALWFDDPQNARRSLYGQMAHFILFRANDFLRPEDAPRLLACEERERRDVDRNGVVTPWWAAAAAELVHEGDSAEAASIVDEALRRFPLSRLGGRDQAVLMGVVWSMNGMGEQNLLVDWFYAAQELVLREGRNEPNHGPAGFLRLVDQSDRAEKSDLLAVLAADERFFLTDWPVLRVMLEMTNAELRRPLVSPDEMFDGRRGDNTEALARWRGLLREHFSKAEPALDDPEKFDRELSD